MIKTAFRRCADIVDQLRYRFRDRNRDMPAYFRWMRELNDEAVRRGLGGFPLSEEILTDGLCCWVEDFDNGLTPSEALTANELS